MMENLAQPIFLRPLWLLLLLLIPLLMLLRRRLKTQRSGWEGLIPKAVLEQATGTHQQPRHVAPWLAVLVVIVAIAMAGPSWRHAETPLHQHEDALVIVLDVSLSMMVEDLPPNRLTVAKRKVRDILAQREGAPTALVAYAGDAHVVSPLTRDGAIIESFLPALDPYMMPAYGGRADRGVAMGVNLLDQGARGHGRILLITDVVRDQWHQGIRQALRDTPYRLDILVTGTEAGGPVPIADRGHLREDGEMVIVGTSLSPLVQIAREHNGEATRAATGDADLEQLGVAASGHTTAQTDAQRLKRVDDGYWLLVLIVPLALLARRHGHFAAIAVLVFVGSWHDNAMALPGEGLWLTPDQQGLRHLDSDPEKAAQRFENVSWQATALYRAGQFEDAAELWSKENTARAHYNRANALAHAGKLLKAIEAYDKALAMKPDFSRAQENRELLENLLEQAPQSQENGSTGAPPSDPEMEQAEGTGEAPRFDPGQEAPSQPPEQPETADRPGDEPRLPEESRSSWSDKDRHEDWLRRIPEDPASLLQRKFRHEHQQRRSQGEARETDELW